MTAMRRSFLHEPPPVAADTTVAARMGLADLSLGPRTGFKGPGAMDWLAGQGLAIGDAANVAYPQANGLLVAKLAPTEALILDCLGGDGAGVDALDRAWSLETARGCYLLPRRDSHVWLRVAGDAAPAMFSKICAVDLRPARFSNHAVAQPSVARLNAIVVRDDLGATPAFHLLADSASADYLWRCLIDAMAEFGGVAVAEDALYRQL